jgi:predicted nucleotidyltransferase
VRLEHGSVEYLRRKLLEIIGPYPELTDSRVFFFGSRVTNQGDERSDIDVGVYGRQPVPSRVWLEIQEAVEELRTLYKIDLVDFQRVSPSFREVALQEVEEIK